MIDTIRFRGPAEYYAFDWDYSRFVGFKTKDNKKEYVNENIIKKTPNIRVWYYPASDTIDVECNPHKIIYGDNVYNYSDSGGALNTLVRQFGNYFYRSGIFPVIGTYSFAAHGGTSQALNQNGLSIRLRPESPGWSNTNPTNGGDIFLDLPLGVKGGLHGGFYVRTTTTGDTTQVNLLTYMQDSLLKMPQYASLSFVTNYRGILATTSTGKVVLADKDVVMGGIVGINSQTGTSYTLGISDVGKTISMTNASANAVTVPPNSSVAFGVGTKITVYQGGSGITSFVAGSGVTINSADSALNLRTIYSTATLTKTGTNSWLLAGDIIP